MSRNDELRGLTDAEREAVRYFDSLSVELTGFSNAGKRFWRAIRAALSRVPVAAKEPVAPKETTAREAGTKQADAQRPHNPEDCL